MFNPQQMLGQLLGDALSGQLGGGRRRSRRAGLSTGTQVQLGLGLLGVAFAAFEHFKQPAATAASGSPASAQPPPPPLASAMPPPPPAAQPAPPEHALHLLRVMITAASADGLIDSAEHERILNRARDAGADADAVLALDGEIRAPLSLQQLLVRTPTALRDEVYAAALLTTQADTDAERQFLDQLCSGLQLDAAARQHIHQQLGFN